MIRVANRRPNPGMGHRPCDEFRAPRRLRSHPWTIIRLHRGPWYHNLGNELAEHGQHRSLQPSDGCVETKPEGPAPEGHGSGSPAVRSGWVATVRVLGGRRAGPRGGGRSASGWIGPMVTNRQFAGFVKATGYRHHRRKEAGRQGFPPTRPTEMLVPGSLVFTPPAGRVSLDNPLVWWRYVPGADWRQPEGPDTTIEGKDDFPVVQVCSGRCCPSPMPDGRANRILPTEAEWESAARGGKERAAFVWGDELRPGGTWHANIWQGEFPGRNTSDDGYPRTAPVATFPPNGFGLFDMAGNVWEWCSDWYRPGYELTPTRNPRGPETSFDPHEPSVRKKVQRGGSFLCTETYCTSYRPGARGKGSPDSAASHVGFRCVRSPERPEG